MFSQEELKSVDSRYFNIITVDDYDVTIQSRNTGHYWYLHSTDVPGDTVCIIFHKHKYSHPYHQHGRGNSLRHFQSVDWCLMRFIHSRTGSCMTF